MSDQNETSVFPVKAGIAPQASAWDRDLFLRKLVRELAGTLEDVLGADEARGIIGLVAQRIGDEVNESYRSTMGVDRLSREQVAEVLVDFKRRIMGDFHVIEQNDERIVLGNRACPFGGQVAGRPTLCMLTTNVFGLIAAENLGYAKVALEETIATGSACCRVVVYLQPTPDAEAAQGREYFQA